jgi:hypothetical protein
MTGTPLLIGTSEVQALHALRDLAAENEVDVRPVHDRPNDRKLMKAHQKRMNAQTIMLPVAYFVTFSIETGHPSGVARHMSMSVKREGRAPLPEAVWMVAQELGFVGGLAQCAVWLENLSDGGKAVNIAQLLALSNDGERA